MGQPENNSTVQGNSKQACWQARWFHRVVRVLYVLLIMGLIGVWVMQPRRLMTVVRIENPQGKPVSGAEVTMHGLTSKTGGYYWAWEEDLYGMKGPFFSDASGLVKFDVPTRVFENLETKEVTLNIRRDGYAPLVTSSNVDSSPPAKAGTWAAFEYIVQSIISSFGERAPVSGIKLERAITVEVTLAPDQPPIDPKRLLVVSGRELIKRNEAWKVSKNGTLINAQIPMGKEDAFFLAYVPEQGDPLFSGLPVLSRRPGLIQILRPGDTNRVELRLSPGHRLAGHLSANVPRPVRNGRVHAWCATGESVWETWVEVDEEGRFIFTSLPRINVELTAICDGYVSEGDVAPKSSLYKAQNMAGGPWRDDNTIVRMIPEAQGELRLVDAEGKPVQGAAISFQPGVGYFVASSVFFGNEFRTEDNLDPQQVKRGRLEQNRRYTRRTDAAGKATIRGLPPGDQYFSIWHDDQVMPVEPVSKMRFGVITVKSAETVTQRVVMEKKTPDWLDP